MENILFIDTETGGFDAGKNAILTFAAVPIIQGVALLDRGREWKIADPGECNAEALAVNKIDLAKHMAEALPPADVVRDFNAWAGEWFPAKRWIQLAAHNHPFDAPFVARLWTLAGQPIRDRFVVHQLCTMSVAKWLQAAGVQYFRSMKLADVCRHYGIEVNEAELHGSLGDAKLGAQLLVKFRQEIGSAFDARVKAQADLREEQDLAQRQDGSPA
jgi:DNA polymerase III epsilon subunit-like protein